MIEITWVNSAYHAGLVQDRVEIRERLWVTLWVKLRVRFKVKGRGRVLPLTLSRLS